MPAVQLLGLAGVERDVQASEVDYLHLLFDQHEIVISAGAPTESLLPGAQALASLDRKALQEIAALMPEKPDHHPAPARPIVERARMVRQVLQQQVRSARKSARARA